MKVLASVGIFIVFFALGLTAILSTQNIDRQVASVARPISRDPAAIKRVYDFSNLEGAELSSASKHRLTSGIQVIPGRDGIGVALGHFVIKGDDGEKVFACQKYGKVLLNFEGEGMVVGGEKPTMEVEGSCDVSADINSIAPLWIPVAKIVGEPVADGEFDFREDKPVKIRFANVSDQWPTTWILKSIQLIEAGENRTAVIVNDKELKELMSRPTLLNFR